MLIKEFKATRGHATMLLFLRTEAALSATIVKRAKYGHIRRNGEIVTTRAPIVTGDIVTVEFPDRASPNISPIDLPIDVLYEDEELIAVNKPRRMPVHPCRGNSLPTLANALAAYFAPAPFTFRAVNRLDADTSGVVLVAKNEWSGYRLSESMKRGEFQKEYLGFVRAVPSPTAARIEAPIAREADGSMRRTVRADGKYALTEYEVTERIGEHSLCRLRLYTGRTHQIRVHMAYIGHPLLFDPLYDLPSKGGGYYLHAHRLTFPHPVTGAMLTVVAPPPPLTMGEQTTS